MSFRELQNYGISGDKGALLELGKRVLDMPIDYEDESHYCYFRDELEGLTDTINTEVPPFCQHCGRWLSDK